MKYIKKKDDTYNFENSIVDKIACSCIDNKNPKYLVIDSKYYSGVIVTDYPRSIYTELMDRLIYLDIDTNISIYLEKVNSYDVIKKLTYHIGNINTDIKMNSNNKQDYEVLNVAYLDARDIRKELQINNESIYNLCMYFSIQDESIDKLKENIKKLQGVLYSFGLISKVPYFRHINLFKTMLPFNNNDNDIKNNARRNMISKTLCNFYPFISSNICDYTGILYGYNLSNKALVLVDRFNLSKYINSNMCVFGASGAGKSFFVKLQILRHYLLKIKQYIIDPEGEYINIANQINGTYIQIGNNTNTYINIFDIYENENTEGIGILEEKIQTLITFFKMMFYELNQEDISYLETKIIQCYNQKGITFNNNSLYIFEKGGIIFVKPKFKKKNDMPIMQDLYDLIKNESKNVRLISLLKPFVSGSLKYFNNYTNVNIENNNIFIDISKVNKKYTDMHLYIIIDFFMKLIKKDSKNKKIIYIDEIWKLINNQNSVCADFAIELFKTIRKYKGSAVGITQDISDLITNQNIYGKTIINNSCFKAIFKLDEENIQNLKTLISISKQEEDRINGLSRGECLLMIDNETVIINVGSSEFEKNILNNITKEDEYN